MINIKFIEMDDQKMKQMKQMEQIFESVTQFSSRMLANRRYIESTEEIMGTTFKLTFELSEREQKLFDSFVQLNKIYSSMVMYPERVIEVFKKQDKTLFEGQVDFDAEPNDIFDQIMVFFSIGTKGESDEITFSVSEDKNSVSLFIRDEEMRTNISLYQKEQHKRDEQGMILNETSLISISNSFESLIFKLISVLITTNNPLKIQEKTLTFKQIKELGGLEEARDYLLEKTVEDVMRGSQLDWMTYIGKNTSKSFFNELVDDEEKNFIDFFLVRNLIIHNNSKINKKYLNASKNKYSDVQKEKLLDKKIPISEEYLLENLSLIYTIGIKSSYYVAKKLFSKNCDEIFDFYETIAYDNLKIDENNVASKIYEMLWQDRDKINASNRMLLCINYMQSLKWLGKNNEMKKILESEDYSLADLEHKMCLKILEDDYSGALIDFENILSGEKEKNDDEINLVTLFLGWPIFKKFSKSNEFVQFMTDNDYLEIEVKEKIID